jgi:hypothetical protein
MTILTAACTTRSVTVGLPRGRFSTLAYVVVTLRALGQFKGEVYEFLGWRSFRAIPGGKGHQCGTCDFTIRFVGETFESHVCFIGDWPYKITNLTL